MVVLKLTQKADKVLLLLVRVLQGHDLLDLGAHLSLQLGVLALEIYCLLAALFAVKVGGIISDNGHADGTVAARSYAGASQSKLSDAKHV